MLKKAVLGWPQIAGLGISLVIAGQFSGWNFGLADNGWANMLLATLLMAALSCGLALCISELSTAMPHAGGVFAYAQSAFGPFVGYLVGSACALALTIGTGAAATFVASYMESVFGFGGWPVKLALFALIIGVHIRGVGEALGFTLLAGAIAAATLLVFGAAMVPHLDVVNLTGTTGSFGDALSLRGIFACVPFAIWMFICIEQVSSAAEEAADPGRSMSRGIIAAVATLLLTAITVLICAPGAAGVQVVGSAADPLYAAMTHSGGHDESSWLAQLVGIGAICGLLATFFSVVYSASRQLFALSRDGYLPAALARTNRRGSPYVALLALAAVGLPLTLVSPEKLLLCVVLLLCTCHLFLFAAYIRMRRTHAHLARPFRLPGGPVIASIGMLLTLMVIAACFQLEVEMLSALAVLAVLLVINYLVRASRGAKPIASENPDHV
ncbi:amino acid permease [Pseudomonas sp. JM0905a]|uniref:Amino acid permease n=1 Tax=Metapseudomonas resinovorans TaxID=53412 RepID=A0ABT4Y8K9_METRE|nr:MULTISPECIES: amino acid permease [Pseudomonas]MBD2840084.1 amino acid permease [Pseudomonas sp. JM0905a]MDA8485208.1 amino acid permease [Pseudomonas resinovorans]